MGSPKEVQEGSKFRLEECLQGQGVEDSEMWQEHRGAEGPEAECQLSVVQARRESEATWEQLVLVPGKDT